MQYYLMAIMVLVLELLVYYMIGEVVVAVAKIEVMQSVKFVLGLFSFYSLISLPYLICLFMRFKVSTFGMTVAACICVMMLLYMRMGCYKAIDMKCVMSDMVRILPYYAILIVLIGMLLYYAVRTGNMGWDTTAYALFIRDSARHNTLYETFMPGSIGGTPGLRYALCSYNMVLAVITQVTSLPALIVARVVGGGCCVILSTLA